MIRLDASRQLLLAFAALGLGACSGGGDPAAGPQAVLTGNDDARLTLSLMDAPVDDLVEVNVQIREIWLKPAGDGPPEQLPLVDSPIALNLLELGGENAALLVDGALIAAGAYEWLAMDVNASIDGVFDSYVVADTGVWWELFVPSGRVRLVDGFEVEANAAVDLIFDWDLRHGLVHPPGLGGPGQTVLLLKPAFRVIDTSAFGRLSASVAIETVMLEGNDCNADVANGSYDVGNALYIFEGHDVTPDDFDEELDTAPLASVDAELSDDSTEYVASTLLPFGDYTAAFTCQAANDLSESNETGNADPDDDTVAFFGTTFNVTISGEPGETGVELEF